MLELHFTENKDLYKKVEKLIARHICGDFEIKRTENGKPYVDGDPVYFSVSHNKGRAVIAICDKPVGVDTEAVEDRKHDAVLSRFTLRERQEIGGDQLKFFKNWTAKEAFIKMKGGTLASFLKRTEFFDGRVFLDGEAQNCGICAHVFNSSIITVCIDNTLK